MGYSFETIKFWDLSTKAGVCFFNPLQKKEFSKNMILPFSRNNSKYLLYQQIAKDNIFLMVYTVNPRRSRPSIILDPNFPRLVSEVKKEI